MIEREEQVAELAKALNEFHCSINCEECKHFYKNYIVPCVDVATAEHLYRKGYRKTNTTDTVLPAEEHKAFLKDLLAAQKATAERARTETAREILRQFGSCDNDEARYKLWCDLCELYGMEVEE